MGPVAYLERATGFEGQMDGFLKGCMSCSWQNQENTFQRGAMLRFFFHSSLLWDSLNEGVIWASVFTSKSPTAAVLSGKKFGRCGERLRGSLVSCAMGILGSSEINTEIVRAF